jgi:hypothetical protein
MKKGGENLLALQISLTGTAIALYPSNHAQKHDEANGQAHFVADL